MDKENYSQQEFFKEEQYISDLIEKNSDKKKSSINIVIGSSLVSSGIVLSFLFLFGLFDTEEIVVPEPITITETVTEKELVMPRVDSTEIVSIAELATKTIVQVQVGNISEDGEFMPNGGGSGVVISDEGLIMTNHHVIDNSTEVRVVFEDGRMYESEIIGSDRLTDIGLLKISASNLVPISIGNSDALFVGDLAVAIGHPLTLGAAPTVTTGVVSALERRLDVGGETINSGVTLFGLIQTDAPITRGSSGGALINSNGELIGITTAIATADVGAEGLGFAVPVNLALGIAGDLLKEGQILHAFLGILGAQHFDTANDGARVFSGVFIQELYGPGNDVFAIGKAGAMPGDIIKKINGINVKTLDGLITVLRQKRAGDTVEIVILRNSQFITLVFELDLRPSDVWRYFLSTF